MRVGARSQSGSLGSSRQRLYPGTEGYTSGALSSDDDFVVNSQRRTRETVIANPPSLISHDATTAAGQSPSP